MKPSYRQPMFDRPLREAELERLSPSDHAMLPRRQLPNALRPPLSSPQGVGAT
jgi:hypothetical protein